MSLPIVAIIGRPNVGKSTLVNRIAGQQEAIVHDQPGVTRDRTYQQAFWCDRDFQVVDTGGLIFEDDTEFLPLIREQAMLALSESQVAIMVVDGQGGVSTTDENIARWLRQQAVPVILAVNKCESEVEGIAQAAEFWSLGLGEPLPISALHGSGTGDLLDQVIAHLPPPATQEPEPEIRIAIIGRPNVGKSSLLNAFVGEGRAIVSPVSGTTRDAIDTLVERQDQRYRLIDTAGIRKKRSVEYGPEFFGINRAFKAIRRCNLVLLVIDALDGVTEQDQKLAGRIEEEGRACVVVVNKWDAVEKNAHTIYEYEEMLRDRLYFLKWADFIFVSALTGQRVERILDLANQAEEQHQRRVTTAVVNEVLEEALSWRSPPSTRQGRQGRIYYGTQVTTRPPSFTLFVNDPKLFKEAYRRYIERQFRQGLGFQGTPLRFFWRGKRQREVEQGANRATRV
jgi:GTP-binding protein